MIRRIDPLISLPATDPARANDFYTRVLGLTAIVSEEKEGFYIYQGGGETMIGVHRYDGVIPAPEAQGVWLWLDVDEIAAARARLEPQGVRFLGQPSVLGPGMQQSFLDSEGNMLRLFELMREVRRSVDIDCTPADAFTALTTAASVSQWFSAIEQVRLDPRLGGEFAFVDPLFGEVEGQITEFEPPHRVAFRFTANWPEELSYHVTPTAHGCRVDVLQRGFDPIKDRDFGIPGLIEHLDQALVVLGELLKVGGLALGVANAARAVKGK